ncbi:MAG: hypothetical protein H0W50_05390 [Parachlamydiaceae bacterium]|nr:hypothetical protein [Parachlamydiaceae bacterium]
MSYIPNFNEIDRSYLILCANSALLCEIRPNMRHISIEYLKDEKKIRIYFFYDTPPSQEDLDYDVEGTIIAEMSADFPDEMQWEERSVVLPYPQRLPDVGICVYRRYEPSLPEDLLNNLI